MIPTFYANRVTNQCISDIVQSLATVARCGATVVREDEWIATVGKSLDLWCECERMHSRACDAVAEMVELTAKNTVPDPEVESIAAKLEFCSCPCFLPPEPQATMFEPPIAEIGSVESAFVHVERHHKVYAAFLKLVTGIFDVASIKSLRLRHSDLTKRED